MRTLGRGPAPRLDLGVQPFTDSDGRSAQLLQTWLTNTVDDPQPLPDYGW